MTICLWWKLKKLEHIFYRKNGSQKFEFQRIVIWSYCKQTVRLPVERMMWIRNIKVGVLCGDCDGQQLYIFPAHSFIIFAFHFLPTELTFKGHTPLISFLFSILGELNFLPFHFLYSHLSILLFPFWFSPTVSVFSFSTSHAIFQNWKRVNRSQSKVNSWLCGGHGGRQVLS